MEFKEQMNIFRERAESAIRTCLPEADTPPARLHEAMRYSMSAGGKRLRPMLVLAVHDLLEGAINPEPAAVALECLHTYSLIHDDLPAMDDSDLRRGSPTCHVQFDEATAILAGDALLTYSFQLLAEHYESWPALAVALVKDLSIAAGSRKLIGGQMEDILSERNGDNNPERLHFIHLNKTAALLQCSLVFGARVAEADGQTLSSVSRMGHHLGLAFQLVDDVLDVSRDTLSLGKPAGIDEKNQTATAVHFYGVSRTKEMATEHSRQALDIAGNLPGDTSFLESLIQWMENRLH